MNDVYLYIYDLSHGLAKTLGQALLGTELDGIWHTAVVVHNREFFYGSHGISYCPPGGTVLREPGQKLYIGQTAVTQRQLFRYLEKLALTLFKGGQYRLFDHNCNTFSNHLVHHLTGRHIPPHILALPELVASTPLGAVLKPALNALSTGIDNVPQFGLQHSNKTDKNNHSVETIRESFRPIMFDEPLPSFLNARRVPLLWPEDDKNHILAGGVLEFVTAEGTQEILSPEHFSLLKLEDIQTEDQCRTVLELFRLALWRNSDLLTVMLTDPERSLFRVAKAPLPTASTAETLELEACRAKLLSNCLGLSTEWPVDDDDDVLRLDTDAILDVCLLLLGHDDHLLPEQASNSSAAAPIPSQSPRLYGMALAHNLALYSSLSEDKAVKLCSFLIHLCGLREPDMDPMETIYLLRAVYFLVVRFPFLADLAQTYDLVGLLASTELGSEERPVYGKLSEGASHIPNDPDVEETINMEQQIREMLIDCLTQLPALHEPNEITIPT